MTVLPISSRRIGLVAGWGEFPITVARRLIEQGYEVVCAGVKDHADSAALSELCTHYRELGLGKLGGAIRYFRRHQVTQATMAGKFHKTRLFKRFLWLRHLPDWRCVRTFYPFLVSRKRDCKDDSMLGAIVDAYAEDGIQFAPATDFAPELLVKEGILCGRLTDAQWKDIRFGWELAREMGRLDVGQSVVVQRQAVLAVEAIEGTDECIRRAGRLSSSGGFTVVKVAKPQQDMRFDVPTIGVGTLQTMVESGGKVLAIEADKTIILDQPQVEQYARKHRLAIAALHEGQWSERQEAA